MVGYLVKRLSSIVALAFGITVVVFLIIHLIPGDPVAALLGTSAADPGLVARLNAQLGLDLRLTAASLSLLLGSAVGVFAALRRTGRRTRPRWRWRWPSCPSRPSGWACC